jgi:hypothetical protein
LAAKEVLLSKNLVYTQEGNKLDFLRNLKKPQRGEINIAWGNAPGNPNYDRVESNQLIIKKPQRGEINIAWGNAPGNPNYDRVESNQLIIFKKLINIKFI